MRAKKTLSLPRAEDLRSNSVKEVKEILRKTFDELDKQWRLLWQDVNTPQIGGDGWIYFGGKNQAGSARIGLVDADWVCQHYIGGVYVSRLGSRA